MPLIDTPLGQVETIRFPNRIVKIGDADAEIVGQIQRRLNSVGCGPVPEDGVFDKAGTERAVKLFQARFPDRNRQAARNRRKNRFIDLGRTVRRRDHAFQFRGPFPAYQSGDGFCSYPGSSHGAAARI